MSNVQVVRRLFNGMYSRKYIFWPSRNLIASVVAESLLVSLHLNVVQYINEMGMYSNA